MLRSGTSVPSTLYHTHRCRHMYHPLPSPLPSPPHHRRYQPLCACSRLLSSMPLSPLTPHSHTPARAAALAPPLFHAPFAAHSPLTPACSRRRSPYRLHRRLSPPLAVPAPPPPLAAATPPLHLPFTGVLTPPMYSSLLSALLLPLPLGHCTCYCHCLCLCLCRCLAIAPAPATVSVSVSVSL